MTKLTPEQEQALRDWAANGATPSDIQKRLEEHFQLRMTYMDVRFLLDDYSVEMRSQTPAQPDVPNEVADGGTDPEVEDADAELVGGGVTVELDRVTRPGSVVSGNVSFSDGVKAQWYLDQYGRLGLDPSGDNKDYRPSPEDIEAFQTELQSLLQKQGY